MVTGDPWVLRMRDKQTRTGEGDYKVGMRKVWGVMDNVFCLASGDGFLDVCPCQTLSHCIL